MLPNSALVETLLPAFGPCSAFGECVQAKWSPQNGHVPRGFLGATAELADVRVVMVFAEPGHPYTDDDYSDCDNPHAILARTVAETYRIFRDGTDQFHRNARWFLNQIWPDLSFDDQLRHVWMTEGRLCSIEDEIGGFSDRLCAPRYLQKQLELLPKAVVVPFGGKARKRVAQVFDQGLKGVYALSPPGANHKPAQPSWQDAVYSVRTALDRAPE